MSCRVDARRHVVPTRVRLVDIVLHDRGPDHPGGTREEAERNSLNGREIDAPAAECRVEEDVEDGDEDDEREGVEVGQHVVRDAVHRHRCCL